MVVNSYIVKEVKRKFDIDIADFHEVYFKQVDETVLKYKPLCEYYYSSYRNEENMYIVLQTGEKIYVKEELIINDSYENVYEEGESLVETIVDKGLKPEEIKCVVLESIGADLNQRWKEITIFKVKNVEIIKRAIVEYQNKVKALME